jgi:hypothetical protein
MKRTLTILLVGLICGAVAHVSWFSMSGFSRPNDLGAQLAWMKANLQLTDAQLQRIEVLHEQSAPQLRALAVKVEGMRDELSAFERERRTEGRIDFLEFARFVEKRRGLDRECVRSTEQLVAAAAEVMTAQQREHYLYLLGPALKTLRSNPPG